MYKRLLITALLVLLGISTELLAQGAATTASVGGKSSDKSGQVLPSATVLAIHRPTGTT